MTAFHRIGIQTGTARRVLVFSPSALPSMFSTTLALWLHRSELRTTNPSRRCEPAKRGTTSLRRETDNLRVRRDGKGNKPGLHWDLRR